MQDVHCGNDYTMTELYFKYRIRRKRKLIKKKRLADHTLFEIKEGNTIHVAINSAIFDHPVQEPKNLK